MKIADLPFHSGDPVEVLSLDRDDPEFTGVGFCRLRSVWLDSRTGEAPIHARDALVLALHSPEEPEPLAEDIELEFADQGASVLLSKFLDVWLPKLLGVGEQVIVLALCNPVGGKVHAPAAAGGLPVCYADGDVESWLEEDEAGAKIRLLADVWRRAV